MESSCHFTQFSYYICTMSLKSWISEYWLTFAEAILHWIFAGRDTGIAFRINLWEKSEGSYHPWFICLVISCFLVQEIYNGKGHDFIGVFNNGNCSLCSYVSFRRVHELWSRFGLRICLEGMELCCLFWVFIRAFSGSIISFIFF